MSRLVLSGMLVALLVLACGGAPPGVSVTPTDPAEGAALADTGWQAVTIAGQPVVVGHEPTAHFTATEVAGTTGCNSYGGGYTSTGGAITFAPLRMTLMGCIGPIGEVEGRFTAAMSGATTARIDPQGRLIIDGTAGSIVFIGLLT